MTAPYRAFGASVDDLVACYPGTDVDDYGGEAEAQALIDRATRIVAASFSEPVHRLLTWGVQTEVLSAGDRFGTTFPLGLGPLVADSVTVYRTTGRPRVTPDPLTGPVTTAYTMSNANVVLDDALTAGEWLLADYRIDPQHADFAWPSAGDVVVILAAAEAGSRLFASTPDAGTDLVDYYRQKAEEWLERLRNGSWLPDELRALRFYQDLATSDGGRVGSVVKRRA